MEPLVSILIPAYNAQNYLADTIKSALAQTWPRKEIIVVDDGSKDRTLEIARNFESKGVRVFSQANQGAAAARNKAFSLSNGDYIQWLDADDLLSPDKIAEQIKELGSLQNQKMLMLSSWGYFFFRWEKAIFRPTSLWCDCAPLEWLLMKMDENLHMQTATWLVSRELTEKAGPWNTSLLGDDDGEYFCRVVLASDGIKFAPKGKVYYRRSGISRLSYIGQSNKKIAAQFLSMKMNIGYVRAIKDTEPVRTACVQYLQTWLIHFYPERQDIVREAELLAREMGGKLKPPQLTWKYAWIQRTFGWKLAKAAQRMLPRLRENATCAFDRFLYHHSKRGKDGPTY
jgi:glycosyltransferase involved in cell wall biosynthesis